MTDLQSDGPLVAQARLHEILWSGATRPPVVASLHILLHSLQAKLLALAGDITQAHKILVDLEPTHPAVLLAHALIAIRVGDFQAAAQLAQQSKEAVASGSPSAHRFRLEALAYGSIAALRLGEKEVAMQRGFRLFSSMESLQLFTPMAFLSPADQHALSALLGQAGDCSGLQLPTLFPQDKLPPAQRPELTNTELTVLKAISTHTTVANAASALFLSPNTVKFHLKNIYKKIGAASRKDALTQAATLGLL